MTCHYIKINTFTNTKLGRLISQGKNIMSVRICKLHCICVMYSDIESISFLLTYFVVFLIRYANSFSKLNDTELLHFALSYAIRVMMSQLLILYLYQVGYEI